MSAPKVTVIYITWNHEKFIEQSIESLAAQTFRDFEVVFLDNASSDNTKAIALQTFAKHGIRVKDISNETPRGVCVNLNALIRNASGELITPLSGDDWWASENLAEKVAYFEKHPEIGFLYGQGYNYYEDTGETELMDASGYRSGRIFDELLVQNFIMAVGHVVPKKVYDEVGAYDESLKVEDWDMWLRIARAYPVGYLDTPLVYYRRHSHSTSAMHSEPYYRERMAVVNKYRAESGFKKAQKKLLLSHYLFHSKTTLPNLVSAAKLSFAKPFLWKTFLRFALTPLLGPIGK